MEESNQMQNPEIENLQTNAPEADTENTIVEQKNEVSAETAPVTETEVEQPAESAETPQTDAAEAPVADYASMSREELTQALAELLNDPDISAIKNRVGDIRLRFLDLNKEVHRQQFETFIAEGGNKDEYEQKDDEVAINFFKTYDIYRTRRQKYQEEQEAEKQENLKQKQQILEELRTLVNSDEEQIKKIYDDFNALQDRWKAIGDIPRESQNDLWQNYHFLLEQFFSKIRMNKELKMLDLKRNLEQKIQLCEKAEELLLEPSITKAFKQMQDLRSQWREIGPVPLEQNDEIWQRFCNAANKIDEQHREQFEARKEELNKNLLAKQALIEKATELTENEPTTIKDWNELTEQLDELLKIWRTIGPVPKEVNDEIWDKFKGMIDNTYTKKKEFFSQIRDEQTENYNQKVNLCLKAEAIAKREDWKKATEELLDLQKQWKEIGSVSRKVSDKIWLRFRGACDEFFAKKEEFFKDIRANEAENLAKKEEILNQLKNYQFGEDKEENLQAIKDFQRRWAEVGFVPMKEKDRLQKDFRNTINGYFEKLRITAREAEETAYRERLKNVAGDAKKFIKGERDEISEKIQKIRSDISLWENNLGFLANSKQAELLKQEFEKKMQGARQQIALLEAKLRILNETKDDENK